MMWEVWEGNGLIDDERSVIARSMEEEEEEKEEVYPPFDLRKR